MKRTIPPSPQPSTLPEQNSQSPKFWEARCSILRKKDNWKQTNINTGIGRPLLYSDPKVLWDMCVEYFNWVEEHPFYEKKVAGVHIGVVIKTDLPKLRPMTASSLCLFIGMRHETWIEGYKKNTAFSKVCLAVEGVIRDQKFSGAAAGFFNHAIIARDLGLVDRQDVTTGGSKMSQTIINNNMNAKEAEKVYKDMLLGEGD